MRDKKKWPLFNGAIKLDYTKKFQTILDRLSFPKILIGWFLIIFLFGVTYFLFSTPTAILYDNLNHYPLKNILDHIYFSFVAATTTGFGDIVPLGMFKVAAVLEIILGIILLAVVTSKLVSIKQDLILGEIYEISFAEKINRLRSSLLLFRQNLNHIIAKTEDGTIKKREINEMYHYLSFLEDTLNEITSILDQENKNSYAKKIDQVNIELIYNSILDSFEKLNELINIFELTNKEWKREISLTLIKRSLEKNSKITELIKTKNLLATMKFNEYISRWNQLNHTLASVLETPKTEKPKVEVVDADNGLKTESKKLDDTAQGK